LPEGHFPPIVNILRPPFSEVSRHQIRAQFRAAEPIAAFVHLEFSFSSRFSPSRFAVHDVFAAWLRSPSAPIIVLLISSVSFAVDLRAQGVTRFSAHDDTNNDVDRTARQT
jgi:hypothetical protein